MKRPFDLISSELATANNRRNDTEVQIRALKKRRKETEQEIRALEKEVNQGASADLALVLPLLLYRDLVTLSQFPIQGKLTGLWFVVNEKPLCHVVVTMRFERIFAPLVFRKNIENLKKHESPMFHLLYENPLPLAWENAIEQSNGHPGQALWELIRYACRRHSVKGDQYKRPISSILLGVWSDSDSEDSTYEPSSDNSDSSGDDDSADAAYIRALVESEEEEEEDESM